MALFVMGSPIVNVPFSLSERNLQMVDHRVQ